MGTEAAGDKELVQLLVGAEELGSGAVAECFGIDGVAVKIIDDHDIALAGAGNYWEYSSLVRVDETRAWRDVSNGNVDAVGGFSVSDGGRRAQVVVVGGEDWGGGLRAVLALAGLIEVAKGGGNGFW